MGRKEGQKEGEKKAGERGSGGKRASAPTWLVCTTPLDLHDIWKQTHTYIQQLYSFTKTYTHHVDCYFSTVSVSKIQHRCSIVLPSKLRLQQINLQHLLSNFWHKQALKQKLVLSIQARYSPGTTGIFGNVKGGQMYLSDVHFQKCHDMTLLMVLSSKATV